MRDKVVNKALLSYRRSIDRSGEENKHYFDLNVQICCILVCYMPMSNFASALAVCFVVYGVGVVQCVQYVEIEMFTV